jgi:Ca2+:H+ antiporter
VPTLVHNLHTPAEPHTEALSAACAVVLLIVFNASIPVALGGGPSALPCPAMETEPAWPVWLAAAVLAGAGIGAALVSDWFVTALCPAAVLGLSGAFTELGIVAIAGNAVENVGGHPDGGAQQTRLRRQPDPQQLAPGSAGFGAGAGPAQLRHWRCAPDSGATRAPGSGAKLGGVLGAFVVYDGESTWLEGLILIGLYGIIAAAF